MTSCAVFGPTPALRISLTRSAYRNVFSVCSQLLKAGLTAAIIRVRAFPVSESLSTYVSLDPRKGVCFLSWSSARMHSLRASSDLLISDPSILVCLSQSTTSAPRSLPARSINVILPG